MPFDRNAYMRNWRHNHKEKMKMYKHNDYIRHRKERLTRALELQKQQRLRTRLEIFRLLGNKCSNPYNLNHGDFSKIKECLQIDHINGNGIEEYGKLSAYTYLNHVLKEIRNGSKNYQLLCANCNWIKRVRNGEVTKANVYKRGWHSIL